MIDDFRGSYRWLSNFEKVNIFYKNKFYSSTEHAYQAAKVLDEYNHSLVQLASTPGKAMRLGRALADRENWKDVKLQIMEDILRIKFIIPKYKELLKNTKNEELIEGNTWNDTFWGVCNGIGQNNLGKLLMKIRQEMQ